MKIEELRQMELPEPRRREAELRVRLPRERARDDLLVLSWITIKSVLMVGASTNVSPIFGVIACVTGVMLTMQKDSRQAPFVEVEFGEMHRFTEQKTISL